MGLFDFLSRKKDDKIHVEFIDIRTGETIAVSMMPQEQLPRTFALNTTLELNGQEWQVEEAAPANAEDFIRTGKLVLKLARLEWVDPNKILMTLPTISSELPAMDTKNSRYAFEHTIYEDDWRQCEFLNISSLERAEEECEAIKFILDNHSQTHEGGITSFDKIHVRSRIGEPELDMDLAKLKDILEVHETGGLKINRHEGFVKDGFAIKTAGTVYYGIQIDGKITHLCGSNFTGHSIHEIEKIRNEFKLLFVNWYRGDILR